MDYLYSIILGIVQGLTEFLPISSSGHLIFSREVLNFNFVDSIGFDVALHLGTLMALVIYFWSDLVKYLKAFLRSFTKLDLKEDFDQRMAWYLVVGSIPAALIGYFFESEIERYFRTLSIVAGTLIIVGILFFIFEKYSKKEDDLKALDFKKVLFIGFAQALALIPGVSRSGITIIAGLSKKLKREVAARFSFLLSVPIVLVAGLQKILDLSGEGLNSSEYLILFLGFISALLTGYFCIKYFLRYLRTHSLNPFAVYRFLIAIVIIIYLMT